MKQSMVLSLKRNCNACRALRHLPTGVSCALGYGNEHTHGKYSGVVIKPIEPCPKPFTEYRLQQLTKKEEKE